MSPHRGRCGRRARRSGRAGRAALALGLAGALGLGAPGCTSLAPPSARPPPELGAAGPLARDRAGPTARGPVRGPEADGPRAARPERGAAEPADPSQSRRSQPSREGPERAATALPERPEPAPAPARPVTPALFWTGVALAAVGAGVAIGAGVAGQTFGKRIDRGYDQGTLDRSGRDDLRARGELANGLATTGVIVGFVGLVTLAVTYAVDWNRCGPVASRHRGRGCPSAR